MPYRSTAQRNYFHAAEARGELSPSVVHEFDDASRGQGDLPYHVKKKKKVKKSAVLIPFPGDPQKGTPVRYLAIPLTKSVPYPEDDSHPSQGGPPNGTNFPPNPPPIPHGKRPRRRVRNSQGGPVPKIMVPTVAKALPGKKESGHKTAPMGYPEKREHYADPKNYKYPLDTPEHTRAANSYLSMPKNQAEYSPEELKTMFARIHRAGKEHGIEFDKDLSVTPAGPSL